MAERRMFSQKIVDSDAFLDMPLSAQALYFHLCMRADDDGFINNTRKIQRMIAASDDDLRLLIAKRFLIAFKNVVVVKHWRMHNLLRKDRYNPTQYKEEYAALTLKENGSYTENAPAEIAVESVATNWQPTGNQLATQDSIGKGILFKDNIDKDNNIILKNNMYVNYSEVINLYNSICVSLPKVKAVSEARKKAIKARLNNYSMEDLKTVFEKTETSEFLKGNNNRNWSATFDWIIKDANFAKILDGNYDNKQAKNTGYSKEQDLNDLDGFID